MPFDPFKEAGALLLDEPKPGAQDSFDPFATGAVEVVDHTPPAAAPKPAKVDPIWQRAEAVHGVFGELTDAEKIPVDAAAAKWAAGKQAEVDAKTAEAARVEKLGKWQYEHNSALENSWPVRTAHRLKEHLEQALTGTAVTVGTELKVPGAKELRDKLTNSWEAENAGQEYADAQGNKVSALASKAAVGVGEVAATGTPAGFLAYATANSIQQHLTQADKAGDTGAAKYVPTVVHAAIDAGSIYAGGKILGAPLEALSGAGPEFSKTITGRALNYVNQKYSLAPAAQKLAKVAGGAASQAILGAGTEAAHYLASVATEGKDFDAGELTKTMMDSLPTNMATGAVAAWVHNVTKTISRRQRELPQAAAGAQAAENFQATATPEEVAKAARPMSQRTFAKVTGIEKSTETQREAFKQAVAEPKSWAAQMAEQHLAEYPELSGKPAVANVGDSSTGAVSPPVAPETWQRPRTEFRQNPGFDIFGEPAAYSDKPDGPMHERNNEFIDREHAMAVGDAVRAGKVVPDEVIADYPDLADANKENKMKTAAVGPLIMAHPASPLVSQVSKAAQSIASMPSRLGRFFSTKPIPGLASVGVENRAFEHASAPMAVPYITRDLLAQVFPNEYKRPGEMANTMEVLNVDNVLGQYDYFVDQSRNAQQAGDAVAEKMWADKADAIGTPQEIDHLDTFVKTASPEIQENIGRWKDVVNPYLDEMFHEQKGLAPGTMPEGRGRHFDARVNLLDVDREAAYKNMAAEGQALPQPNAANFRNPNVKRDPYARHATGTGTYSTDAEAILNGVLHNRLNEVTKLRLYKDLVDKGVAAWDTAPGPDYKSLPVQFPSNSGDGTTYPTKNLYVRSDLVPELRRVLNTDMKLEGNTVFKNSTNLQLAVSLVDLVAHAKNQHTAMVWALKGTPMWDEILRKVPGIGSADAITKMIGTAMEVHGDSPQMRSELSFLARNGMLRPDLPKADTTGVFGKIKAAANKGGEALHASDTAVRVLANRYFDNLVAQGAAVDTMENRRQYVNKIGVYNRRLMGQWQQIARDSALSPFVVAGRAFNTLGRRIVTGDPGFSTTSRAQQLRARAIQVSGLATAAAIPAIINAAINHGDPFGPAGTPLGAVGYKDDDGKLQIYDLFQTLGIRRGLRATGMNAVMRSVNEQRDLHEILDEGIHDIASSMMHPWVGPPVDLGVTTAFGHDASMRQGPQPYIARNVKGAGQSQYVENFRVALKNQNPLVYAIAQPILERGGMSDGESRADNVKRGTVGAFESALGHSVRDTPAVRYLKEAAASRGTFAPSDAGAERADIRKGLRKNDPTALMSAMEAGTVTDKSANKMIAGAGLPEVISRAKYAPVDDVLIAWSKGDADEKVQLMPILTDKLNRALDKKKGLPPADRAMLMEKMKAVKFGM
jgi:hypothetical protein